MQARFPALPLAFHQVLLCSAFSTSVCWPFYLSPFSNQRPSDRLTARGLADGNPPTSTDFQDTPAEITSKVQLIWPVEHFLASAFQSANSFSFWLYKLNQFIPGFTPLCSRRLVSRMPNATVGNGKIYLNTNREKLCS